jgi:uncharacterized cupin superfamily protein
MDETFSLPVKQTKDMKGMVMMALAIGSSLALKSWHLSTFSVAIGLTSSVPSEVPLTSVHDSTQIVIQKTPFTHPLDDTRPQTGEVEFGITDTLRVGLWEHTKGASLQENDDEVFVVLKGKGRIIFEDGETFDLKEGTVGRLLAGKNRKWEISEDFRKVWIVTKENGVL